MKIAVDIENFEEAIKGADLPAKRKAFRNHLPYAVLRDGVVTLVFPDKHTEIATQERLKELQVSL
ncbi:hypothetical protein KXD93_26470 [Mucilaginibacter sp. BJC16-A38]|uniref:hypothetical protein n=1 Tax=Mucilaginibacter phenanthrenivorans TaxID=1234842 RepID=UPI002157ED34|nr:hypothetical protein [Mucilaginibacter phenanthrenivorans]MCR8561225.1 hypothetical protein [Mucilaginibacter phenanthrenivorans]